MRDRTASGAKTRVPVIKCGAMQLRVRLLSMILMAFTAFMVNAQSGRRGTGGSTSTTTNTSVSGAKPVEKKPEVVPKVQLLIGIDGRQVFANVPFHVYDTVLENCIRRLDEAEIVFTNSAGNNMNQTEARKAAKQEKTRWVVSLEVRSIYADAGKQVRNGQDELYVEYTVFEPETGNIKHSGRTRTVIDQNGRGGVTSPNRNGPVYSDYSIRQAAREAADRILAEFDIKVRETPF